MCWCDTDVSAGIAKLKYGWGLVKNCPTTIKIHGAMCITLLKIIAENNLYTKCSTISEVDLCIFVIHVHSEFRLKIIWIFKSKGNNSTENDLTRTKFELNQSCVFSWHIYILNFNWKCQFELEIMSRNWKLLEFFLVQGALLCQKLFDRTQIRTQAAYSHYTSI